MTKVHFGCKGFAQLGGENVGQYPLHRFNWDYSPAPLETWPLRIDFAGEDIWVRGCYRFRRRSDTFALEYLLEGELEFIQNQTAYRILPGDLFLVRLGADSEIRCPNADRAVKLTLSLSGTLLESTLASFGLDRLDRMTPAQPERLKELLREAPDILKLEGEERFRRGTLLAFEILLLLGEEFRRIERPEILTRILARMESSLGEPHTVASLAGEFGVSQGTLHRLFRKELGDTPLNYLIAKRIEAAKRMLRLTSEPIKAIAFEVGYRNPFHFSTEFRRLTGQSPRVFRETRE